MPESPLWISESEEDERSTNSDTDYEPPRISSDNESGSSDNENQSGTENDIQSEAQNNNLSDVENIVLEKRKRSKKGQANSDNWVQSKNQKLREKGMSYYGVCRKKGKQQYTEFRPARIMKPECNCALSKRNGVIKCLKFSEPERKEIYAGFWKLSWPEKKTTVRLLTRCTLPKDKKNCKSACSRRKNSNFYHLKKKGFGLVRVCKKMFLNTLGLNEWMVLDWTKKNRNLPNAPEKPINKRKSDTNRINAAHDFLNSLQKVPSHYCRQSTSMLYLETLWLSKVEVHRAYVDYCKEKNVQPYEFKKFDEIMNDLNIRIFKPRKDQCDVCVSHTNGNLSDAEWEEHRLKKEECRKVKENDKNDPNLKYVFTMDLQAVLICPRMLASALYYRTKLSVHNFTLYNLKTKDGYCFLWNESEGGITANEFTTLICNFVKDFNVEEGEEVVLYSDGCTYQNRNSILSNGLVNLAMQLNITIYQKYLEKGHTQMECDSMHSNIEKQLKGGIDITLPSTYVTACKKARRMQPYDVKELEYSYFQNYKDNVVHYTSIRPGIKSGDPQVVDLRALKYTPEGNIFYKINVNDDWKILPQRRKTQTLVQMEEIPKLYKRRLPIEKRKYNHLQEIKSVLPKDTHAFYNDLPFA